MAMISMSPLRCPNCQSQMQHITSRFGRTFFHDWACIWCKRFYDRADLIQEGVLDETDDWENMCYVDGNYEIDDMSNFCEGCQHKNAYCRSTCPLCDDSDNTTY